MAFIEKKDPVLLNIKLTSKGRELLSKGDLNFSYFTVGDSEIDYSFNNQSNINTSLLKILKPVDKNPSQLSYITKIVSGDTYNVIKSVSSTPTIIQNESTERGFFLKIGEDYSFINDTVHLKQGDVMVDISTLSGGTTLNLLKSPTYTSNVNEPEIGDFVLIKWTNPKNISTTGYTISTQTPNPILVYKIQDIVTGSLFNNNLEILVDRELPNFQNVTGGSFGNYAGCIVFNFTEVSNLDISPINYIDDSVLTFLENSQCEITPFPFWNLSIVHGEEIIGKGINDKTFTQFNTSELGGFISYIQNQNPILKKIGIIHYTNQSPTNEYGESLYQATPILNIPTIMWHKSTTKKMGLKLTGVGSKKTLTGTTSSLNTEYYDLADENGYIVGKILNNLKIFLIEDQELLFALSYKSNRSWTLPDYNVEINANAIIGCTKCTLEFTVSATTVSSLGNEDASISIYDIYEDVGQLILEIFEGSNRIYHEPITGTTRIDNLGVGSYTVNLYDLGVGNCTISSGITITNPVSITEIYDLNTTLSELNPNFMALAGERESAYSPTTWWVFEQNVGTYRGNLRVGYKPYGSVADPIWYPMTDLSGPQNAGIYGYVFNTLTFKQPYTMIIRDSGSTFDHRASINFIAVNTAINDNFTVNAIPKTEPTYGVLISNYKKTINANNNPIIGVIEFAIGERYGVPLNWTVGTVLSNGSVFVNAPRAGRFDVYMRERDTTTNIVIDIVKKTNILIEKKI